MLVRCCKRLRARAVRATEDGTAFGRERGTSLFELLVGMTLMVVFGGMFTGAILLMNGTANKTESVTLTSNSLSTMFLKLDKTVRYAAAISTPGKGTSGDWYVEFRSTYTGSEVCTQLRIDSQKLWMRTWNVSAATSTASSVSKWTPLGSDISNGGAAAGSTDVPFTLTAPSAAIAFQQLKLTLVATAGLTQKTTSRSTVSFTALNSNASSIPTNVCQQNPPGRP